MRHFWAQNGAIVPNKFFFWKKLLISFSSTYWPLSLCKILKILTADPELWGCVIFGPKMVHLRQTKIFLEKIINIIFIYLLATFIVQNFKNSYSGPRVMTMRHFWAQNRPFAQIRIFFRKPVNKALFLSSIPIYMPKIKVRR